MTAHIHSALLHRFAVPAWLLVAVLAAVIALALVAVLDNPAAPAPVQSNAPVSPESCISTAAVGHC